MNLKKIIYFVNPMKSKMIMKNNNIIYMKISQINLKVNKIMIKIKN